MASGKMVSIARVLPAAMRALTIVALWAGATMSSFALAVEEEDQGRRAGKIKGLGDVDDVSVVLAAHGDGSCEKAAGLWCGRAAAKEQKEQGAEAQGVQVRGAESTGWGRR